MKNIYVGLQRIFPFAFPILWLGGTFVLFSRFRRAQRAYLRRFPPGAGVPLEMYVGGGPRSVTRAIFRLMWRRQDDPELERLRRGVWRSYRTVALWGFGVPLLCFGVITLLILTDHPPTA